jgi:uncharacterized protein YgbK (DUF1537 family)
MTGQDGAPLVVLDDDPTGTQAVANVPVLLDWSPELVAAAARPAPSALHLLTNSRAYPPAEARRTVRGAAEAAVAGLGSPRLALRGDSTLRAHLLEEYLGLCDAAHPGSTPPLLLVPALPAAGRVTVGGVHLLERDGVRTPLHETEYAADPSFAYTDARLLRWADERSGGFFARARGREIPLERLRTEGPAALESALLELAEAGAPAACAPDAESLDDLELIAEGLRGAEARGAAIVLRSAPTFVGVLAGNLARQRVDPPSRDGGLLVVCGSWVPASTRQLAALLEAHPGTLVEADVEALASSEPGTEIARAATEASRLLQERALAVLATPRVRPAGTETFEAGQRIALNLARTAGAVEGAGLVVAKGGITAHVTARDGLRAHGGLVLGPLVDGVALWRLSTGEGRLLPYVVFPGNVGGDGTLREVVDLLLAA